MNTILQAPAFVPRMGSLMRELELAAMELEQPELEITKRSGQVTINWAGPFGVREAIAAGKGKKGVYVIYQSGRVMDSGKADAQDLGTRLAQHFEYYLRHGTDLRPYRVRLGFVRNAKSINLAEGVLTRSLAKKGMIPARRNSLMTGKRERVPNTARFASPGGVRVMHGGRLPGEMRSFTQKRKGRQVQTIAPRTKSWELPPPHLMSEAALELELEVAAAGLEGFASGESELGQKRYIYLDAWLRTPAGGYEFLEKVGWWEETKAWAESQRFTLQLKWQAPARARGGTLLVRCFVWNGQQAVECNSTFF